MRLRSSRRRLPSRSARGGFSLGQVGRQGVQVVVGNLGAEAVATYTKTPMSQRQYCAQCGGHLMTEHAPLGLIDVYAATIPSVEFRPALQVNYAETVLPMKDGLPKLRDFPAELGGSGVVDPE